VSATLVARDLTAGHGDRLLFAGLDLVVAPGDVIGLVGANGAGKSTLLRLLAGIDRADHGSVTRNPASATVGYLPQEPERREGETVAAFLARRTGVAEAQQEMDAAADALAHGVAGADDRYGHALERWLALGGADLEDRMVAVLADVGLGVGPDVAMTTLSGGQAARAGLASLLLSRYDVFLLDEPTNDLDLDGLDRLERFVGGLRAGTVVVSHDREFLSRTRRPGRRAGPRAAAGLGLRRRLHGVPRGARHRAAAGPGGLRGVRRDPRRSRGAGAHPTGLDGEGRPQRPPQGHRQR
jgi:ATPase subunit of ABC transporter with duplicated ATPase domains